MSDQWYYKRGDKQGGPVSGTALKELAANGQLSPTDMVWTDGMSAWAPASSMKGLFASNPSAQPTSVGKQSPSSAGGRVFRFHCPACDFGYDVPQSGAGQKFNCQKCGQRIQVPTPAQDKTMLGKLPGEITVAQIPPAMPVMPPSSKLNVWSILLLLGAGLLFINFFLPWWSIEVRPAGRIGPWHELEWKEVREGQNRYYRWMREHGFISQGESFGRLLRVWGWKTGAGIMGFAFSFLVLGATIPSLFVRVLQPWLWIPCFMSALGGLALLILSMFWILGSPSGTFGEISGGNLIGPYIHLLASLLLLVGGSLNGLFQFSARHS